MHIACLDLEGVLVPEIWIEFSKRTGIPELSRTTRDEPDYDKLMRFRLGLLEERRLGLPDIQAVIGGMGPMPGAREFLSLRRLSIAARQAGISTRPGHSCALNILQATGDNRKVALWLGHESIQTTEDYLRVDVTQRIGVLKAVTPPQLRPGKFHPPDKLIASLHA